MPHNALRYIQTMRHIRKGEFIKKVCGNPGQKEKAIVRAELQLKRQDELLKQRWGVYDGEWTPNNRERSPFKSLP
ncbi:hypothetical protein H8E77_15875 [bacterium]|nr:hypothetical protein [bacterium]